MNRTDLIRALEAHPAHDKTEAGHIVATIRLIENVPDCFHRHEMRGHVTGSGLLLSRDGTKILMNYHGTLKKWLHFGGHADGDENIARVAAREVLEESGIADFVPVLDGLLDVDVHPIPENPKRAEGAHNHHDCIFLYRCTGSEDPTISDESVELRWMTADDVLRHNTSDAFARLVEKWKMWQNQAL